LSQGLVKTLIRRFNVAPVNLQKLSFNATAYRARQWALAILFIVSGALAVAVVVDWRTQHALKVRLLTANPDRISVDRRLREYALPLGHTAFNRHCAGCHGVQMRGDRARGVPDLTDGDWLYGRGRVGEIERVVMYGIRSGHSKTFKLASMPAFATANPYSRYAIEPLSRQEVDDVTALIYSFQHKTGIDAVAVQRGSTIYHGKGLCFDCHGDHATGDPAIGAPNLTDSIWLSGVGSIEDIKASIERGAAGICPQFSSRLPPETMRAIAVYVSSSHS